MKNPQRGGMILGLFIGLVVGIGIAFAVVWYLNKTPLPFQDKGGRAEHKDQPAANGAPAQPQPLPGKPGDKASERPRFDFYKILPGEQQAKPQGTMPAPGQAQAPSPAPVPGKPATPAAPGAAEQAVAPPPAELLYLQAGSFQKAQDADNLKAKLSMLGLEVGVQEVNVPDKGTMHRVRLGPFASVDEMNRVRTQLSTNGVQATLVKVKPQ